MNCVRIIVLFLVIVTVVEGKPPKGLVMNNKTLSNPPLPDSPPKMGSGAGDPSAPPDMGGTGVSSSYWPNPSRITVCWEQTGWWREKQLVQDAIRNSWSAYSSLRFIGWSTCGRGGADIRIVIQDERPHVQRIGTQLRNLRNGMSLNFEYRRDITSCRNRKEFCTKAIAIHEFGHAIGLAHEQNRPDAPSWCREQAQATTGDHLITVYDPQSIMNYCSDDWSNGGRLTELDKQAVQWLYPTSRSRRCASNEFTCGNGRCISSSWQCDGDNDCGNGADEYPRNNNCRRNRACRSHEFTCGNGRCIPSSWQCDGDNDCGNLVDEYPYNRRCRRHGYRYGHGHHHYRTSDAGLPENSDLDTNECERSTFDRPLKACCLNKVVDLAPGLASADAAAAGCCEGHSMNVLTQTCCVTGPVLNGSPCR